MSQTSTSLNATPTGLHDSMRRLDASRCNPAANQTRIDAPLVRNGEASADSNLSVNLGFGIGGRGGIVPAAGHEVIFVRLRVESFPLAAPQGPSRD